MSGIAGLIAFEGRAVAPGLIEAMTEAMAHRGPDGVCCWSSGSVALGHCMLRTTPESLEETQPLANEDESVVLVMDGRVDNWGELRDALSACRLRLRNRSDAELVLRAYETWGGDCLDHMDGDFALAIWDWRRGEAFFARDRMGHKPLHYHWNGSCLAFASELHAILALPWVDEALNEGLIAEYLAADLCSLDETLWKGLLRLPPAHRMTVDPKGPRVERYWAPNLDAALRYRREEEYAEHYRALLNDVVRQQSRSQTTVAFEVSGGLDSSAVFALAQTQRRREQLLSPAVDAYTLQFETGAAARDLPHARAVGTYYDCSVREIAPTQKPLDWYSDWASRYRELPTAPHGTMQLGIYEAAAASGSRVIVGGDGGDQWLTGDHSYFAACLAAGRWGDFLACLRRDARTYGLWRSAFLAARFGAVPLLPPDIRRRARRAVAGLRGRTEDRAHWLAGPLAETLADRQGQRVPSDLRGQAPEHREKLRLLQSAYNVTAQEAMDRLAASRGLELRSPLNSAAIAQFGFSVPEHWLLRNGWNRYIHRLALKGLLPETVIWRRDKAEFSVTIDRLSSELSHSVMRGFAAMPEPWLSRDQLARLCASATDRRPRDLMQLWAVFSCSAVRQTTKLHFKYE